MSLKKLKTQFNDLVTPPPIPEQKLHYRLATSTLYANVGALPSAAANNGSYVFVGTGWDSTDRQLFHSNDNVWVDTNLTLAEQNLKFYYVGYGSGQPLVQATTSGLFNWGIPYSRTTDLGNVSGNVDLSDYNGHKITMTLTGATTITALPDYCSLLIALGGEELNLTLDRHHLILNGLTDLFFSNPNLNTGGSGDLLSLNMVVSPFISVGYVLD
jgi:hypothetical protein